MWGIFATLALLTRELIETIYLIESSPINIYNFKYLFCLSFLCFLIIGSNLIVMSRIGNLTKVNIRSKEHQFFIFREIVLVFLLLYIFATYFIPLLKGLPYISKKFLVLFTVDHFLTITSLFITEIPLEFTYFIREKKSLFDKAIMSIYKYKYFVFSLKIISTGCLMYILIKNVVMSYFDKEILLTVIMLIVIIILIVLSLLISNSIYKQKYYLELKREILFSDMSSNIVRDIIENTMLGESTINWVESEIAKIELERIKLDEKIQSIVNVDDKRIQMKNFNDKLDKYIDALNEYYLCKKTLLSYLEVNKRHEWEERINLLRIKVHS